MFTKFINRKVLTVLLLIMCVSTNLFSQTYVNREWQTNAGNPLFLQWHNSIISQDGQLITVGNTSVSGEGANVLLTKYDGEGNIDWMVDYNTSGTYNDYGVDLVEDSNGYIYVCGATDNGGITDFDIIVLKYNSSGTLIWDIRYNSSYNKNDVASSIKEIGGYIYLGGASEGDTTQFDFLTLKYDNTGGLEWDARYDYTSLNEFPAGVEIIGSSIVMAGASASSSTNWDYTVVEYNAANGTQISVERNSVSGSGYDQANAYIKDNSGNIYITGKGSTNGTNYNIKTIKLDATFNVVWDTTYDECGLEDQASAIAIDANGNVIVGGFVTNSNSIKEGCAIMYDSNGTELWKYERSSDDPNYDASVKGIAINGDNEIILSIQIKGLNGTHDIAIIKLSSDGDVVWERTIHSLINEIPTGVQIDDDGAIYITYVQDIGATATMYTVERYTEHTMDTTLLYTSNGKPVCLANQLIVKFKQGTLKTQAIDNTLGTAKIEFGSLDYFLTTTANTAIQNALADICIAPESGSSNPSCPVIVTRVYPDLQTTLTYTITRQGDTIPLPDFWTTLLLEFPYNMDIKDVKIRLDTLHSVVDHCEANTIGQLFAGANDTHYNTNQHSLHKISSSIYNNADINIEPAWDVVTSGGKKFVRAGVIDMGANWQHPEFGYNGTPNSSKVKGFNLDNNTVLTDNPGGDLALGGHGTQCLGIIGAIRNNNQGVAGIEGGNFVGASDLSDAGISLFSLRVRLDSINYVTLKDVCNATLTSSIYDTSADYKYGLHAQNHSWGIWPSLITSSGMTVDSASTVLRQAVKGAYRNLVTLVASRGSTDKLDSLMTPAYPACFDDDWVINVGATGNDGHAANGFGNGPVETAHGFNMDIGAPGVNPITYTTAATSSYWTFQGTSASAPHVTGVVGLLMSYMNDTSANYKNLAPEDCEAIIQLSAKDNNWYFDTVLGSFSGYLGYDSLSGFGRLNAGRALQIIEKPYNTLYHFGTNPNATCSRTFSYSTFSTNDTITIEEPYENKANTWFKKGKYIVNTFKINFQANYTLGTNDSIISFWPRPSSSNLYPLFDTANVLLPHEKLNITSCNNTQTNTHGYIYQVYDTTATFLGWWPEDLITPFPDGVKAEFSILTHDKTYFPTNTSSNTIIDNNIIIYPNPSSGTQIIEISNTKSESIKIELYDISGRKLLNVYGGNSTNGVTTIKSNISTFTSGVYMYKIQIGSKMKNIKIIKQ